MPFIKQSYRTLQEKLDAEKDSHRGRDYAAFTELISLYKARPGRLPLTVVAYLMDVSPGTIRGWLRQLPERKENARD